MDKAFWQQQAGNKPLFEDLLWSRPENKNLAGKLLIVGGNLHGFSAPAGAYNEALKAGAGQARVLLPDALKKTVGKLIDEAEFAPSTRTGSFAGPALAELMDHSSWADAVLLAGDFGKNSETAILLEKFLDKYKGLATLTKDALDFFLSQKLLLERENTVLVLTISQLQKLGMAAGVTKPFTSGMDLIAMVDELHDLTQKYKAAIVVSHLGQAVVAYKGQVSTTRANENAARASVWALQNPDSLFKALTCSVFVS